MSDLHARTQLRRGIAAALAGLPATGTNVFPSRMFSLSEDQLPSLSVFTTDDSSAEEVSKITMGRPALIWRTLPVIIEGHAMIDEGVDDVLDQIALEVERAMSAEIRVADKPISTRPVSTQIFLSGEGEEQVGIVRLTYSIPYATLETTPETIE